MTDSIHSPSGPDNQRPTLTPPDREETEKKDNRLTLLLIMASLLVLLVLAAMVIWLLPNSADRKNITAGKTSIPPVTAVQETATDLDEKAGLEAEQLLGEWLRLQARAEAEEVAVWGADRYPAIIEEAAAGDRMYQEKKYSASASAYRKSIRELNSLMASKNERLLTALQKGAQALAEHDGPGAAEYFDMALTIDPHNEEARLGAGRTSTLGQVLALYEEGLELERQGKLHAARQVLQEALDVDSAFTPAREALTRIDNRIKELAFQKVMSRTLDALNKNDTGEARKALAEAAGLRPDDPSVRDAGFRLLAMERAQKLDQLQNKAARLAAEERWAETLKVYDEMLSIDTHFAFAEAGRKTAQQRYELDNLVLKILARPGRLQESGPMQEAEMTLARLQSIENPGPRLRKQIKELSSLIRTASTPIEITLRSDNETSVVIYRVGKFGSFQEKKVSLLPGSYTVVGSRPGYRDVRKDFRVEGGSRQVIIDIRCEEPI